MARYERAPYGKGHARRVIDAGETVTCLWCQKTVPKIQANQKFCCSRHGDRFRKQQMIVIPRHIYEHVIQQLRDSAVVLGGKKIEPTSS